MLTDATAQRWAARPVQAWTIRVFVFLVPIVGSIVFVRYASDVIAVPTSSFLLFLTWWLAMSGGATVVLLVLERAARRLLPLVALYKLSLVFPDAAPSRFRAALKHHTVESLEQRIADARTAGDGSTPIPAAERLLGLVDELNAHDPLTRGHSERVRAYAQMIGEQLHLDKDELELLNWSALLHDIGKLEIPTEVLAKEGKPTDEEWELLRRHPALGAEIIEPIKEWLGSWGDAVSEHHEHWDGHGYPQGLAGEEIGLAARIVAVADVFDVITSARSYKSAFASPAARDEIARCAGTQFDPRVVRAFLNISLGRLRLVMGPLSWLAHVPILGRLPFTPAIGSVAASVGTVAAALSTGVVAVKPPPVLASTGPITVIARPLDRTTAEDTTLRIRVAGPGSRVISLAIEQRPELGRVRLTAGHEILYVPPPNYSGRVTIGYEICVVDQGCRHGLIRIAVTPVNDPPVARDDRAKTVEDTPVTIDVLANDSDVEGDHLVVVATTGGPGGSTTVVGNRVRFVPASRFSGVATAGYEVSDGHGGTARARIRVDVAPAPAPVPPTSVPRSRGEPAPRPSSPSRPASLAEAPKVLPVVSGDAPNGAPDAQADSLSLPAGGSSLIDVLANDSDPDGDPLSLVSVQAPPRGTAAIVGDRVRFTAPSTGAGEIGFAYTIADSHGARASAQVSVTVTPVNAAPVFTAGPDQTVDEDAGAVAVPGWATGIGAGAPSESGQSVSFVVANDDNALFAVQPSVDGSGTLRYTTATNAYGKAAVTVRAKDDGGTADGGIDTSAPQSFTITIRPVNDPPVFAAGADQAVPEGTGAVVVPGWATGIGPGAPGESAQSVSFLVSSDNAALFAVQPTVDAAGTLRFTTAASSSGTAILTVRARDDGGTANGGVDTSPAQSITITVTHVNHPPVANPDTATVDEDSAAGVTFNVLPNDTDPDLGDVLSLGSYDGSGIVGGSLTDNGGGSFTYVPDPGFVGTDAFTYVVDDGHGGTSSATARIEVTPVQHPPTAGADAYTAQQDTPLVVAAPGVLGNDGDEDGDTITLDTTPVSGPANGTVSLSSDGSFTYTPGSGFTGSDEFTYRIDDGTGRTADGTVSITVTASATAVSTLYFQPGNPLSDLWAMAPALAPAAAQLADFDSDGKPGLTLKSSDGKESISEGSKYQTWTYTAPGAMILNGPVSLDVWSSTGTFGNVQAGTIYAYLYDCTSGGASCTKIASNAVVNDPWNTSLIDWGKRTITIGSVNSTIAAGHELRVKLLFRSRDLWMTMSASYPTALNVTLG